MVENAKQPETESVADVYERPEMTNEYEYDFAKSFYKPPQLNTEQSTEQDSGIKLNQAMERTWESDQLPKVLGFVKRIVELCWWMQAVQPQVHLDCNIPTDGKFIQEHYKPYMKSGSKIDYIVWPVMFLHENGPLLSKGVAQLL